MPRLPDSSEQDADPLWTRTARRSRKAVRRLNKSIMRSHHFRIPKYDMPIRLRPVRPLLNWRTQCFDTLGLTVVPAVHLPHSDQPGSSGLHELLACASAERQSTPLSLYGHCYGGLLLHLRRRGVSRVSMLRDEQHTQCYTKQGGQAYLVLAECTLDIHWYRLLLLRRRHQRDCTIIAPGMLSVHGKRYTNTN